MTCKTCDHENLPGSSDECRECGAKPKGWVKKARKRTASESAPELSKEKKAYLDYVLLTDEEHAKLQATLGPYFTGYITRLNDYIENLEFKAKGSGVKKYASHYKTILRWRDDDKKKQSNTGSGSSCGLPTYEG